MARDKWMKRWYIPSYTDPDKEYVVAMDWFGNYGCSCPVWRFRRQECHHIREVKENRTDVQVLTSVQDCGTMDRSSEQ